MVRTHKTTTETLGYLFIAGEWFRTLERPWQDNERNVSCIPSYEYDATFLPRSASGKYTNVYHVTPVAQRSGILIHKGNLVSHTLGCILLGTRVGRLGNQLAVLNSATAMAKLNKLLDGQSFSLEIM